MTYAKGRGPFPLNNACAPRDDHGSTPGHPKLGVFHIACSRGGRGRSAARCPAIHKRRRTHITGATGPKQPAYPSCHEDGVAARLGERREGIRPADAAGEDSRAGFRVPGRLPVRVPDQGHRDQRGQLRRRHSQDRLSCVRGLCGDWIAPFSLDLQVRTMCRFHPVPGDAVLLYSHVFDCCSTKDNHATAYSPQRSFVPRLAAANAHPSNPTKSPLPASPLLFSSALECNCCVYHQ